ncbi:MAG: metal-dependent phosphohydrolase, partial [Clostridia bacterium]|nr:metal-dependent phosphohydrolase [Clostridia bacterium]
LHDLWAYKSGSYDDHAHLGADYARKVLGKMEITTADETEIICDAIWHHDDKASIDTPFAEVLKDADVIDHCLTDPTKEIKEKERSRYKKLCREFGLTEAAE